MTEFEMIRGAIPADEAQRLFLHLEQNTQWTRPLIRARGRNYRVPRDTAWHGDPGACYSYSGIDNDPTPWTDELRKLKAEIESRSSAKFNSLLLNFYRNERDSVSWHSDDEPELGSRPVIASLSLGETREFLCRRKYSQGGEVQSFQLNSGDLLVMRGRSQADWVHSIPKAQTRKAGRINLTFRWIHPK